MSQVTPRYNVADLDTPSSTTNLLNPSGQSSVQAALLRGPRTMRSTLSSASLFSLSPDPESWGSHLSPNYTEPDDYLHNPDPRRDKDNDRGRNIFTWRGLSNLGCLAVLILALIALFAGYPIITFFTKSPLSRQGGFNFGGVNSSGQVPQISGARSLIDNDTPQNRFTRSSFHDPSQELQLVFSDEFNVDGRTFYPGDDPYWEAVDLHYWQTGNLEWYDPGAIMTRNGALEITLSQKASHDLQYTGGMLSTWNKFCFTGGLLETSVTLPGANNVFGLWPAIWTMGNLGRAGYGASLEGMWPYTYDSCDVGTLANQTKDGLPLAATENGDPYHDNILSYLQGQRLSRCTCPGEAHPGPLHSDGTFVGRSAPEIDVFEATVHTGTLLGQVSQSCQFAPFNHGYIWPNQTNSVVYDPTVTKINPYKGGVFQQAVSGLTDTDTAAYEENGANFAVYGFEYKPGTDNAYITWISSNKTSWTLLSAGVGPDPITEISARPIPQEPMYIIANVGISPLFGPIDFQHLNFPVTMRIDYIRVYQPKDQINIGCDPEAFPTSAYINQLVA
ncbi:beta-glucan synthesis-associated [Lactifluus subvellereus]|nr:beta-glucan synthesis-associated [Lactifluus subvellereus]